jgi:hypothetical protein
MKTYVVQIPIAGSMSITVEAESKDTAIAAAWEKFNSEGAEDFEIEWEALESVGEGNVSCCPVSRQSAQEVK